MVVSSDSTIPHHTDRSRDSGTNTIGVSVAQLPRKRKIRRVGQCFRSSKLDPENNHDSILSQDDLNKLVSKYGFPPNVEVRLLCPEEKANSSNKNWTCFYIVLFHLGLRFPIRGSLRDLLIHYDLAPCPIYAQHM